MNTETRNIERVLSMPWVYSLGRAAILILLSQTQIIGVYPFGIAYAALLAEKNAVMASVVLALGALMQGKTVAVKYTLGLLIYIVTVYFRRFKDYQVKAVALGVAIIVSAAAVLVRSAATPAQIIMILPEAFAIGGLYYLFCYAKKGGIAAYGKEIIITGACLGGLYGLTIPYFSVDAALLAGVIIIMCVSYSCGIAVASLTGAVLGFMILMESSASVEVAGMFAVSAALAAAVAKMGKAGVSTGFLSGMTICILCMGKLGVLSVSDIFAAPIIFLLMPEKIIVKAGNRINPFFYQENSETEKVANRLKTVAKAVGDLGNGVKILAKTDKKEEDFCGAVYDSVCKSCRYGENCFFAKNMYILKKTLEKDGYLKLSNAPQGLGKSCIRAETLLKEFSHTYELYKQNLVYSGEARYDRNIAINQYGELSNIIKSLSVSLEDRAETGGKIEKYRVSVAVCQEPRDEQEINGDTVIHFKNGDRYFVILCDGMGAGKKAREISSLSAHLFAEFLSSGIDKKSAVNMINSALALNADRESFSSADILEINLATGDAEFMKIGSAQSFINRNGEIAEISSSALPIGILENIEVMPQRFSVELNDMILMVSDGISEASNGVMKNEWIKRIFSKSGENDEALCKRLLESARARMLYGDDLTSVIVRIKKAG